MPTHRVGEALSLLRQGLTLGVQFGTDSLEALLWVAETVEEAVYEPHSLRRRPDGLAFALDNPPLRVGAFSSVAVRVDGTELSADRVRLRSEPGSAWRSAATVGPSSPYVLRPGDRTEFELTGSFGSGDRPITVRLELRTPAVPPLVWLEFAEAPGVEVPGR